MGYKAGFLGLIGQPNAGKSTLMNYLVDEKVSIVSAKPQTTRRRILGMWSSDQGQIVFVDAPGIIKADEGLNGFLAREAQDVIDNSDALLAIISVDTDKAEQAEQVIDLVSKSGKPWVAVITKVDLEEKAHRVMILKKMIEDKGGTVFSTTVKDKEAEEDREELLLKFLELLPESPAPLYDTELFTNENTREMVSEIIRERCFENLHQEVPYNLAVRIIRFDEIAKPIPKIYAEIIVSKESHKAIVIGKGAAIIKTIGTEARKEIEKLMDEKIFLDVQVVSKPEWFDNKRIMKELGYVIDNKG